MFGNSAPTHALNAKAYPQAAAHAWTIRTRPPTRVLSPRASPLYYTGDQSQNTRSRARICPTGRAKDNGDASALVDVSDELNCDECAFTSSYNSGGMSAAESGLNPATVAGSTPRPAMRVSTPTRRNWGQRYTRSALTAPTRRSASACRPSMSGMHNKESMGGNFGTFMRAMRIMDKDTYWLDTRMTAGQHMPARQCHTGRLQADHPVEVAPRNGTGPRPQRGGGRFCVPVTPWISGPMAVLRPVRRPGQWTDRCNCRQR